VASATGQSVTAIAINEEMTANRAKIRVFSNAQKLENVMVSFISRDRIDPPGVWSK